MTGRPETVTLPAPGGEDAVEVQHQGGLAGAVGAEQRDPLALVDVQVDAVQRLVAVGVGVRQPCDVEDGDAHGGHSWSSRHRAGVAAGQHREVHPLAALVGADEQRAGGAREDRPVPRVAGGEAARLPGHLHPPHLVGDHVEVADHEAHDLHQQRRHPQPLEPGEQVARLGGRGQGQAGQHAERALGQQRPRRASRPCSLTRRPSTSTCGPGGDERQQQREHARTGPRRPSA